MSYPVEDWDYNRLLEKCYLCQPATFSRRDILLDHGFLNENYHLALDLEFWLRIGKYENFIRVREQLAATEMLYQQIKLLPVTNANRSTSSRVCAHWEFESKTALVCG